MSNEETLAVILNTLNTLDTKIEEVKVEVKAMNMAYQDLAVWKGEARGRFERGVDEFKRINAQISQIENNLKELHREVEDEIKDIKRAQGKKASKEDLKKEIDSIEKRGKLLVMTFLAGAGAAGGGIGAFLMKMFQEGANVTGGNPPPVP